MNGEIITAHKALIGDYSVQLSGLDDTERVTIIGLRASTNYIDIPMRHWPQIVEAVERLKPLRGTIVEF